MNTTIEDVRKQELYYRLVALWAVCEAFAGGIMHALKMPFTGLIIGGLAVFCIIQIGYHIKGKWVIMKATLLVCIFKLMLSPYSPPTAYIAVGFQGLMGQLLFYRRFSNAGAIFLAIIALVESSIQRILVAVLIYGTSFWKAVNEFLKKTFHSDESINYLLLLTLGYILMHAIVGLAIGIYASKLARSSIGNKEKHPEYLIILSTENISSEINRKKIRSKKWIWVTGLLLLFFFIQSQLDPAHALLPKGKVVEIIVRALLIIFVWTVIISPLIMQWIRKILLAKKGNQGDEIAKVSSLLPDMRQLFSGSLQMSAKEKGLKRINLFFKILMINIV